MVDAADGPLQYHGRAINDVAYIYCVGSRQGDAGPNQYCSRFCCTAAVHASLELNGKDPSAHQYHLYRDMRTYGRFELLYEESREKGALPQVPGRTATRGEQGHERQARGQGVRRADESERSPTSGRSRSACHRHGAERERRTRQGPQASDRPGRLLQFPPPQASTGRDGRGRCRICGTFSCPKPQARA